MAAFGGGEGKADFPGSGGAGPGFFHGGSGGAGPITFAFYTPPDFAAAPGGAAFTIGVDFKAVLVFAAISAFSVGARYVGYAIVSVAAIFSCGFNSIIS